MSDYIVGLTGGVASGKSEVARRFAAFGVVVADADVAARAALAPGSQGLAEVIAEFGEGVLDAQGALDRVAMRERVFADDAVRRRLEAIVHPRVRAALQVECTMAAGPYSIAAIPLLFESGGASAFPWLQRILVVDVPRNLQLTRLLLRDGIDIGLAERMLTAQASRQQRLAIADDVIENDEPLKTLERKIAELDARYRSLALA